MLSVRSTTLRWFPLVILLVASLQACSGTVERGEVRKIQIGTPREEVEALLGEPVGTEETDDGLVYVYEYFEDANEAAGLPSNYGGCVGGCAMAYLLIIPVTLAADASGAWDETRELVVGYSSNDQVKYLLSGPMTDQHIDALKGDDSSAQFALSRKALTAGSRFYWVCIAAHNGHAEAQARLGEVYFYGAQADRPYPIEPKMEKAFVWFSLAEKNGYADKGVHWFDGQEYHHQTYSARLSDRMTEEQVTNAQQALANWRSNPSECEAESRLVDK